MIYIRETHLHRVFIYRKVSCENLKILAVFLTVDERKLRQKRGDQ